MKKVSHRRAELHKRAESISRISRKVRWWGLAALLLGVGLSLGGFFIGTLIYYFAFGLLLFSFFTGFMAWRLKQRFRRT